MIVLIDTLDGSGDYNMVKGRLTKFIKQGTKKLKNLKGKPFSSKVVTLKKGNKSNIDVLVRFGNKGKISGKSITLFVTSKQSSDKLKKIIKVINKDTLSLGSGIGSPRMALTKFKKLEEKFR